MVEKHCNACETAARAGMVKITKNFYSVKIFCDGYLSVNARTRSFPVF